MQRRILMTGRKDTKTGLCMLPLAMDESMISHVAASTTSQGASDILELFILQAAHQNAQDMPYLHTNSSQDIWDVSYQHLTLPTIQAPPAVEEQGTRTSPQHKTDQTSWQTIDRQDRTIQVTTPELACNLTPSTNMEELAKYHHQRISSPTKTALLQGIANLQLRSFPGLIYELISKHFPPSTAKDKGHTIMQRQRVQLTRS